MLNKARIAVLVSGGGTNLEALLNAQETGALPHGEIVLVLSSNPEAYALERAKRRGVPAIPLSRKQLGQEPFEAALMEALTQYRVDLVVLAGFLSILSADFVRRWPDRIVNVHPSLIPAFCGKGYYGLKVHEAALRTREFEPDGPNWTPRISGLLGPNGSYKLSILKAADGTGRRCLRQTFEYPGQPGTGHFLHTYAGDGDPLPSFTGEPEQVAVEEDIDSLASAVWDALDEANRISLFVRFTDLETRDFQQRIVNKYSGKETQA